MSSAGAAAGTANGPSGAPGRLWIEAPEGTPAPAELPRSGALTIGSDPARADLCILGEGVAPVHCAIGRAKGGGWAVKDLGSSSGTRLNGARVEAARLSTGDELALGARRLRIVSRPGESRERASDPPPRIEGYRLLRRLGQGAMGQVWLGVQQSLEREVALKVLAADVEADRAFVERFQGEARAAAALNHPNVVTVFDVGESGGVHYLSMEYMDAGNLEERVAKVGPLPPEEVVRILRDAASGLVYADSKGIVHRDLKPANLMQNRAGTTKIADLGLATRAGVDAEEGGRKILGTPHFMAPEQVRGERLDSRTDLYALGATAYRLLSGRTPFEGTSTRELLRAQLRETPKPLVERAPETPPGLAAVVHRMLEKDPAARFPSASSLLRALEDVERPTVPLKRKGPLAVGLLLVVLLGLVGAAIGALFVLPGEDGTAAETTRPTIGAPAPPPPPTPLALDEREPGTTEADTALELREAQARLALVDLERATREGGDEGDTIARLRALAERFPGTAAAGEASARANALAEEDARRSAGLQARERALAEFRVKLRESAGLTAPGGLERTPAEALAQLAELPAPPEIAADPALAAERLSLSRAVLDAARERARAGLAEAERRAERGDFSGAATLLESLPERAALPPALSPPAPDDPLGEPARALAELASRARDELASLDSRKTAWRAEQTREDARALAESFSAGAGLEREIAALRLDEALSRVEGALEGLSAPDARGFATDLAADLASAHDVFAVLGREFSGSGWRRRTVDDPRDRRAGTVEALGADERGLLLPPAPGGDGPQKLPWSAFSADARELHRLFYDRLQRPWSADEQRSIATLMRLACVSRAATAAAPLLAPDGRGTPSERDLRSLAESFDSARGWATDGESAERLAREEQALRRMLEVGQLASAGSVSAAGARLEHLLADLGDTLLVRLLSDGSGLAARSALGFEPLSAASETGSSPPSDGKGENKGDGKHDDQTRERR